MKTVVVPRKGANKPYLCDIYDKSEYRQLLTKELTRLELKELSQKEKVVTDNWLTYWINQYYNGKA
jgi:hypothetical protein